MEGKVSIKEICNIMTSRNIASLMPAKCGDRLTGRWASAIAHQTTWQDSRRALPPRVLKLDSKGRASCEPQAPRHTIAVGDGPGLRTT